MLPTDPSDSYHLLPQAALDFLSQADPIRKLEGSPNPKVERRATIYQRRDSGQQVRFQEIFTKAKERLSAGLQSVDTLMVVARNNEPADWVRSLPPGAAKQLEGSHYIYTVSMSRLREDTAGLLPLSIRNLADAGDPGFVFADWVATKFNKTVKAEIEQIGFILEDVPAVPIPVPAVPGPLAPAPSVNTQIQWAWLPANGDPAGGGFDLVDVNAADGGSGVTVAILDTGLETSHRGLTANQGARTPNMSLNFCVDPPDQDAEDRVGHGTHCASILIGKSAAFQFQGICPNVSLLIARVSLDKQVQEAPVARAILWAVQQGARVISMSFVTTGLPAGMEAAIEGAPDTLFIAAADDNTDDLKDHPKNPCCLRKPNLLSIISLARSGGLAPGSDHDSSGEGFAHVAAPGEGIYICHLHGSFESRTGTSLAAPHVAGLAALMFQRRPDAKPKHVIASIRRTVVTGVAGGFDGLCQFNGRIDAKAAIADLLSHPLD